MEASGLGHQTGVVGPMSVAPPSDADRQATVALVDELKRQNNYESATETNKRYVDRHDHMVIYTLLSASVAIVQSVDS